MRFKQLVFLVFCAFFLGWAPAARAACGDSVSGQRVACRCGDVVVSDVRLRADDPVILGACVFDGLTVRPPAGSTGLTVDLDGLTLRGSGRGTGLRVLGSGAVVVRGGKGTVRGRIVGFGVGLKAAGTRALSSVSNLIVEDNARQGIFVRDRDSLLSGVLARRNGADGVRVSGRNARLHRVEATNNGGAGVVTSRYGSGRGITASGNASVQVRSGGSLEEAQR